MNIDEATLLILSSDSITDEVIDLLLAHVNKLDASKRHEAKVKAHRAWQEENIILIDAHEQHVRDVWDAQDRGSSCSPSGEW